MVDGTVTCDQVFSDEVTYRVLSKAAVISVVTGILSIAALLFLPLVFLPALGLASGLIALRNITRYPDELSGKVLAWSGVVLSGLLLAASVTTHTVAAATEVPDGYTRVSFEDLQPVPEHPDLPYSPLAEQLDGKRVYIKGYTYPDGRQYDIKRFVMVRDLGTCCFGGQPKLTHMVEVTLQDPLRIQYSMRKRGLGGVLKVDKELKPVSGVQGVYFQLDADYVR